MYTFFGFCLQFTWQTDERDKTTNEETLEGKGEAGGEETTDKTKGKGKQESKETDKGHKERWK